MKEQHNSRKRSKYCKCIGMKAQKSTGQCRWRARGDLNPRPQAFFAFKLAPKAYATLRPVQLGYGPRFLSFLFSITLISKCFPSGILMSRDIVENFNIFAFFIFTTIRFGLKIWLQIFFEIENENGSFFLSLFGHYLIEVSDKSCF